MTIARNVRRLNSYRGDGRQRSGPKIVCPLWKLGGLTPWNLGKLVYKKFGQDELSTRSASLSYYFLLAVFPMFLFLLSLGLIQSSGPTLFPFSEGWRPDQRSRLSRASSPKP
jgi:hypothetical protein